MKKFKQLTEQHREKGRFKPVLPHNVPQVPGAMMRKEEAEDTEEKIEMVQSQLHFISYACKEILEYIDMGGEVEEWYQVKIAKSFSEFESLHSFIEGEKRRTDMVKEEVESLDEISAETKAAYTLKAKQQVKELEPHAKKGEYKDLAKNLIAKRKKGIAMAEGSTEKDPVWNKGTPMPKDYTCHCGLYVHPDRRNPKAIHTPDCPYAKKQGVAEASFTAAASMHAATRGRDPQRRDPEHNFKVGDDVVTTKGGKSGTVVFVNGEKIHVKGTNPYYPDRVTHHTASELKKGLAEGENKEMKDKDPCWKGYEMVGMKDKGGKKVPNCVPVKEEAEQVDEAEKIQKHRPGWMTRMIKRDNPEMAKKLNQGREMNKLMHKYGGKTSEEIAKMKKEAVDMKDVPFEGGKPAKGTVTDKSGAKHTPMSRVRDLARKAMQKQMPKTKVKESTGKAEIVKKAAKDSKEKFNPDPVLTNSVMKENK